MIHCEQLPELLHKLAIIVELCIWLWQEIFHNVFSAISAGGLSDVHSLKMCERNFALYKCKFCVHISQKVCILIPL